MSHEEAQKFILNFLISGTVAALSKTIVAPIDRIKLIIQNQDSALQVLLGSRKKYSGIINVLLRTPKEQGILSLWRGNGTNLLRYFPAQALNFSFKDLYTSWITDTLPDFASKVKVASYLSGGFAGISSTAIVYPLEFCQTKITVDVGSDHSMKAETRREYCGLPDCLKKVYHEEGVKGFYRGLTVATIGVGIYRALYFGLYDDLKTIWSTKYSSSYVDGNLPAGSQSTDKPSAGKPSAGNPFSGNTSEGNPSAGNTFAGNPSEGNPASGLSENYKQSTISTSNSPPVNNSTNEGQIPLHVTVLIAQIVAATSGIISYPFDTIGRRLMLDSGRPKELMLHSNWISAARHIYVQDGMTGFFKGWIANLMRSFGGALVLVSYDQVLYFTNWKEGFDKD